MTGWSVILALASMGLLALLALMVFKLASSADVDTTRLSIAIGFFSALATGVGGYIAGKNSKG